jgi:hypothetical protein
LRSAHNNRYAVEYQPTHVKRSALIMAVTRATALAVRTNKNALQDALLDFQNRLGKEDRKDFDAQASIPDASAVINLVTKLDKANRDRKGRCFASRLHVVLESINQFSLVVSTFVSSNPATAALVWGSVQFTLLVSRMAPAQRT